MLRIGQGAALSQTTVAISPAVSEEWQVGVEQNRADCSIKSLD